MSLYETIYVRRQVKKFTNTPLDAQTLDAINHFVKNSDQLLGQNAQFEIVSVGETTGGQAPHYLVSFCDDTNAAYANVGYVLQKADLYIQSMGLGSSWFAGQRLRNDNKNYATVLAFGYTDTPKRKNHHEFKRLPVAKISQVDNKVARAVRLAPSALNSQSWKLEFEEGKVIVVNCERGVRNYFLHDKLHRINAGIAARHAVLALEQEGKKIIDIVPRTWGKEFEIIIFYDEYKHGNYNYISSRVSPQYRKVAG